MTYAIRARAALILLATCIITTRAVTSPEEATAACALENDAVASCDDSEFGDDASRRLLGDDDDAATFCSFAGPTLAAQCDTRDTCAAEYRAYLTCYYRALCEDPTLGCAPLAADDPPATTAPAPSSNPMADSCGELVPVAIDECPEDPNILAACDVVACGELCEGAGECGTTDIDNCVVVVDDDSTVYDVYRKYCGTVTLAPSPNPRPSRCGVALEPVEPEDCPAGANTLWPCDVVACGEFCEGDGECGTDQGLNNCGGSFDIYHKFCESPAPTATLAPSQAPTATLAPSSSPAPTATPAPSASPAPSYSPAPTATQAPTPELRGCKRRLLRHTDLGDSQEAHRRLSRCPPDGARGLTVGLAAAAWLLIA